MMGQVQLYLLLFTYNELTPGRTTLAERHRYSNTTLKLKPNHCVYCNPSITTIPSHINPVHAISSYLFKIYFSIILPHT